MKSQYAGDVTPGDAWKILKDQDDAYLVDVRTSAEWHYVGAPDLSSIDKELIKIEWRMLPDMAKNMQFLEKLQNFIPEHNSKIFFICRTGGRSMEAAIIATEHGYANCFNIIGGFEGELNNKLHRGLVAGWKAEKLPWRQD